MNVVLSISTHIGHLTQDFYAKFVPPLAKSVYLKVDEEQEKHHSFRHTLQLELKCDSRMSKH